MYNKTRKRANDVNGSSLTSGVASGREAIRESQIVNMRNPWGGVLKIGIWNVRSMIQPSSFEPVIKTTAWPH